MNQIKNIFNMSDLLNLMVMTMLILSLVACAENGGSLDFELSDSVSPESASNQARASGGDEEDPLGGSTSGGDQGSLSSTGGDVDAGVSNIPPDIATIECSDEQLEVIEDGQVVCVSSDPNNPECFQFDLAGLSCVDRDGDCYWVCDLDVQIDDQYIDEDDTRTHITRYDEYAHESDVGGMEPERLNSLSPFGPCVESACIFDRPTISERLIAHCEDQKFIEVIIHRTEEATINVISVDDTSLLFTIDRTITTEIKPDWVGCEGTAYFIASTLRGQLMKGSTQNDRLTPIEIEEGEIKNLKMNNTNIPDSSSLSWSQNREEVGGLEAGGVTVSSAYRWRSNMDGGQVSELETHGDLFDEFNVSQLLNELGNFVLNSWISEGVVYHSVSELDSIEGATRIELYRGTATELFSSWGWVIWRDVNDLFMFPWSYGVGQDGVNGELIQVYLEGLNRPQIVSVYGPNALISSLEDETHRWWVYNFNQRSLNSYPPLNGLSPRDLTTGHNWLMWTEVTEEGSYLYIQNWMSDWAP